MEFKFVIELGHLISTFMASLALLVVSRIGKAISSSLKKILHRVDYIEIMQESIDHALEQSIKEGYSLNKSEKFEELSKKRKFIQGGN
jgi:hypothetical protein